MLTYILRRLALTIPVLIGITFIVFALLAFAPGDAISLMLGTEAANPEIIERRRAELGLDKPWLQQYTDYMGRLLRGDLGRSFTYGTPVNTMVAERLPNTLVLTIASMIVALLIALPLGTLSAVKRNTVWDYSAMFISMAGVSMPNFWLGLLLIITFGLELRWLPIRGLGDISDGLWQYLRHLILPAVTLGTSLAAILMRLTRNSMLDVLGEDYIRTARAKGLSGRPVIFKHALRNALIPVVTTAGVQFGALLGGAVVVETIFSLPGLGLLAINAIQARDIPVIQGSVLVFSLCFVLVTLLVDLLYAVINPRVRYA